MSAIAAHYVRIKSAAAQGGRQDSRILRLKGTQGPQARDCCGALLCGESSGVGRAGEPDHCGGACL